MADQQAVSPDAEAAHQTWRHVADQLRPRWPKLRGERERPVDHGV